MSNLIEQIADEVGVQIKLASTKDFLSRGSNSLYMHILVDYFISVQKSQGDDRQYTQSNSPHVTMKNYGTQQRRKKQN